MALLPFISFLLILTISTLVQPQTVNYRLPDIYKPSQYFLSLTVPRNVFTETGNEYNGTVAIIFTSTQSTSEYKLHASYDYINITSVFVDGINASSYSINNVTDILTVTTNQTIQANTTYNITIAFTGKLSTTEMTGFYKSSYVDSLNNTKYLATTQFQPTSARRAFPCFDEPALKATFTLDITVPQGLNVLSNQQVNNSTTTANNPDGTQTVRFIETPKMSTYLLAFIISEFNCTTGDSINSVIYQVCSRMETHRTREWALEIGPKLLSALNNFTMIDYNVSLLKLDQVAIPDFSAGAMENWGLITYRERALLWDPQESPNIFKQSVATIIAHEMAHLWFGDLVTMRWWSETFLNEGFATYFEYFTTHQVLPEWKLDKQFVLDVVHSALQADALDTAPTLQSNVSTPNEIMAMFGTITYSKGGSIFRMLSHIMGVENFRAGLRRYLNENRLSNTTSEILWTSLTPHINSTMSKLPAALNVVMQNWIQNPGFPLITVTRNGTNVIISQERFSLNVTNRTEWYVPVTYTTSEHQNKFESTSPDQWLVPNGTLTIPLPVNAWIIVNNQRTGFYRVNYDLSLWQAIRDALLNQTLGENSEISKAQIVDDLFNLARYNKLNYSTVFDILQFLRSDDSYFTWQPTFSGFNFLLGRVGFESQLGRAISNNVSSLMSKLHESTPIGILNETDQIYTLKQVLALTWACRLGNSSCIQVSRDLYLNYKINGTRPNKNLRNIVYCNALRNSTDKSDWDFLWNSYLQTTIITEKSIILTSLGCSQNQTILEEYLNKSISDYSGIRSQDRYAVFSSVLTGNSIGVNIALRFLIDNHLIIAEKYQSMNSMSNILNTIANRITNDEHLNQLQQFIQNGTLSEEFLPAANNALQAAQANLQSMRKVQDDLYNYFGLTNTTEVPASASGIYISTTILIFIFCWHLLDSIFMP